jgi:MerR family copper efflux transcriptional regulator
VDPLTIGEAAGQTGWSPRMLRYLERAGLVRPVRMPNGYRVYGSRELEQLRRLADLRRRFRLQLAELAFAARMRRDPALRAAVDGWFAANAVADAAGSNVAWVDWEQRKQERLLAA